MEDMLRDAMEGAAANPGMAKQFDEALGRYRAHPGILRKQVRVRG